jgi:hypothetical protein
MMMPDEFERLQKGVERRQNELAESENKLARAAHRLRIRSAICKVLVIIGGAVVASRGVAEQIVGSDNNAVLVTYTVLGVAIAALGALEAAFRWEARSTELNSLAATTRTAARRADTVWRKEVLQAGNDPLSGLGDVIDVQDDALTSVHNRAASLGVNVSLELNPDGAGSSKIPYPYPA